VVVRDNDPERARQEALRLASGFWPNRARMQARLTSVEESVRQALQTKGTVILVDAADATSSGAPGDSNAILAELLRVGYPGTALIPLVDPAAVETAFAAGIGATMRTRVGAAFDQRRCQPVEVTAQVHLLSDGRFRSESFNQEWHSGKTAVLQAGTITLVVMSRPVHLFDRSLFYAHGQDPRRFDLVVVKSPHCQPHMFADWCSRLINVDAPGATSANLPTLGHTRCRRPIYPLDPDVTFTPEAKLFSRSR
jgi:microcystin degradation protein MlrC